MKSSLAILLSLGLSFFSSTAFCATDADAALAAAKDFARAVQTKDFARVADLADLEQLRAIGGRDKLIDALRNAEEVQTVQVLDISFSGKTERIPATGAVIYRIDSSLLARYKAATTIRITTFYVVYRLQDKSSWHIIDGSKFTVAQLAKQFSGIPEETSFPKVVAEVVKEENSFRSEVRQK
jgi:hypothetical protein